MVSAGIAKLLPDTELLMYDGSALAYMLVNAIKEQQATYR
jgi:hypothetical protein